MQSVDGGLKTVPAENVLTFTRAAVSKGVEQTIYSSLKIMANPSA